MARKFSVSRSTVYDHVKQMRETGFAVVQTSKRGRKPILSQQLDEIAEPITNQHDISIHEIKKKLALPDNNTLKTLLITSKIILISI